MECTLRPSQIRWWIERRQGFPLSVRSVWSESRRFHAGFKEPSVQRIDILTSTSSQFGNRQQMKRWRSNVNPGRTNPDACLSAKHLLHRTLCLKLGSELLL